MSSKQIKGEEELSPKILILGAAFFISTAGTASSENMVIPHGKAKTLTLQQTIRWQLKIIRHDKWVIRTRKAHFLPVVYFARKQLAWTQKELQENRKRLNPWGRMSIVAYIKTHHPCLAGIIARENASYDPTLNYGGGHGDTSVAYGIPQATPGYKMASAGADWATNPWTQLKWMIGYTVGKFGSECAALYSRVHYGMY